jgi:O-antigen ligase/tetratricopeptide (TPR) repeat protein
MCALRLSRLLLLWASVVALWFLAYLRSASAVSFDRRLVWCLPLVLGAHVLGALLAHRVDRRRGDRTTLDGHGLALLVSALATLAATHVLPHTSVHVLRNEIAPLFAWLPPLVAFLAPVLLSVSRSRLDLADQALALALLIMPLSGALLLVEGPAALCVAGLALMWALESSGGRLPRPATLVLGLVTAGLLIVAGLHGRDPLQAAPAMPWIGAWTAVMAAVAARPRSGSDWRLLLAMPVVSAVVVAICGVLLTIWLALEVDWGAALRTRLTLFRQHPNFLAPFFGFHAVLALGLAVSGRRGRVAALLAALLLAASTLHTDSRAGIALLVLGVVSVPALALARRVVGPERPRLLAALLIGGPIVVLVLFAAVGPSLLPDAWTAGLDRFEKSVDYRADAWRNGLALANQNPLGGIGPRTFLSVERFAAGSRFFNAPESPHPHNVLLYLAQSAGWPGLIAFLAWLAVLLGELLAPTREGRSGALQLVLAASLLALVGANMLDVGLALDSVVPEPLFLVAGLVASLSARVDARALRTGPKLILATLLLLPLYGYGLRPLMASSLLERAELSALLAGQRSGDEALMASARDDARAAIGFDADLEPAYELLSRWLESTDEGLVAAVDVLTSLRDRAPHHGRTSSRLAQLYLRARMDEEAVVELRAALADSHGSVFLSQDRAELVSALARLGKRDEAMDALVEALGLDVGVINAVRWRLGGDGTRYLAVGGDGRPLVLSDAIEILFGKHVRSRGAGEPVGRRAWMDVVTSFRRAGRDDRALVVLEELHAFVPEVERQSIANERGLIALDAGDGPAALRHFEEAFALSGNPFFHVQADRARRLMGEEPSAPVSSTSVVSAMGEILDIPEAFLKALQGRIQSAEDGGRQEQAALLLRKTLLFVDDPLERARVLQRCADQHLAAGEPQLAADAVVDALWHLDAKPYPRALLTEGLTDAWPARLAVVANSAWSALQLDNQQRMQRAWAIPSFFHATPAAGLFRAAFFAELGKPDAQLREADLALLMDESDLNARWARLEALEALGRHADAEATMRDIAEQVRDVAQVNLDRLFNQVVEQGQDRLDDWEAWFEAGLVRLLQGRYAEAADLMGAALEHHAGRADERARLLGWQARAELFSDRPASLRTTLRLLEEARDLAPATGSLTLRYQTLR